MSQRFRFALYIALGGFVFGFDATVISGALSFITEEFSLTSWQQGMVVSSPTLGALIAMGFSGALADRIGRKNTLISVSIVFIVSALFSALAVSYETILIARFVGGFAFCCLMIAPLYIAEISDQASRGRLVSMSQLNIVLGLSASYFTNYGLLALTDNGSVLIGDQSVAVWRLMLGLELVPAMLWLLLLIRVPESPRWLLMKGEEQRLMATLSRLFADNLQAELQRLQALPQSLPPLTTRLRMLTHPQLRLPLLLCLVVGLTQQLSGINAVFFYAPTIFENTGVSIDGAFLQSILVGLTNVIFTFVAIATIDRFGRRPLLVTGLIGIVFSLSVCAYGFRAGPEQASVWVLAGILLFVASFAMSLGPVMWVLFSEVFPERVRAVAISAVTVVNSTASYLVQLVFPLSIEVLSISGTFMMFALFSAIGLYFIYRYLPETKGRPLGDLG